MTIEEYSSLMGYGQTCPKEEYEKANAAYMMIDNISKEMFCAKYRKLRDACLFELVVDKAAKLDKNLRYLQSEVVKSASVLLAVADTLLEHGSKENASEIDAAIVNIIGRKESIRIKLENGLELSRCDRGFILNNLK